jgi:predicted nucleic acid-binding protein
MIVADAGPIIGFARIGRLDLLRQVVGELVVPDAVYEDLVGKGRARPGAEDVERGTWIHRRAVGEHIMGVQRPPDLGRGEWEAILLAREHGARLLVDERKAREAAASLALEMFGSLWVLAEAKRRGLLTEVKPVITQLLASGYWMDEEALVRPFLEEVGEGSD